MKNVLKQLTVMVLVIVPLAAVVGQGREVREGDRIQQRDGSRIGMIIPDLTDDQQEKIKELHLNMMKESLQIRNKLGENRAKLRTLQTAENPDMKAIDKLIDESAQLHADMQKKAAANHQEVRSLLTEEQRVVFDTHSEGMRARATRRQGREGMRGQRQRIRTHSPQGGLE